MTERTRKRCDPHHCLPLLQDVNSLEITPDFITKMDSIPAQIVAEFYEACLESSRWPQALLTIGDWVKADVAALATHNFETGSGQFDRALGLSSESQSAYRRQQAGASIWLQSESHFREAPKVVRGSEIVDERTLRASPFYRNWLKGAGLLHHLFVVLSRSGANMTFLMLAYREGKPDFSLEVVEHIRALLPGLERALSFGPRVRRMRSLERAALRAMDMMPVGAAVLDMQGAVLEANSLARAAIDAGDGVALTNGGLFTFYGGRRTTLRDMITRIGGREQNADEPILFAVPRSAGRRPLTIMLLPIGDDQDSAGPGEFGSAPSALLFIGDPDRPTHFDPARIARLYGLSRAESRVAALLASGYRLDQVAETLDIAYETVRKHLKQIFGKTATSRQAELVRMLVTGPAGLTL